MSAGWQGLMFTTYLVSLERTDVTLRANGNSEATLLCFKHSRSVFQEDRRDIDFFGLPGVLLLRVMNVTHVIIVGPPCERFYASLVIQMMSHHSNETCLLSEQRRKNINVDSNDAPLRIRMNLYADDTCLFACWIDFTLFSVTTTKMTGVNILGI